MNDNNFSGSIVAPVCSMALDWRRKLLLPRPDQAAESEPHLAETEENWTENKQGCSNMIGPKLFG